MSMLDVFKEMTRLKEENWALKAEIERISSDWKTFFLLCKDGPPQLERKRTPDTVREMLSEYCETIWPTEVAELGAAVAIAHAKDRLSSRVALQGSIGYNNFGKDPYVSLWVLKTNPCEWSKP